jgi:hypothetical protein
MNSDATGVDKQHNDHAVYAAQCLINKGLDKEWEVVVATEYTLQLDIDRIAVPDTFPRLIGILEEQVGPVRYEVSASKSGNTHVIITMQNPMPITERVAWQAIFGSDPIREAAHLSSIKREELNPILLFQCKFAGQLSSPPEPKLLAAGAPSEAALNEKASIAGQTSPDYQREYAIEEIGYRREYAIEEIEDVL